jgi:hypothetical protein
MSTEMRSTVDSSTDFGRDSANQQTASSQNHISLMAHIYLQYPHIVENSHLFAPVIDQWLLTHSIEGEKENPVTNVYRKINVSQFVAAGQRFAKTYKWRIFNASLRY